jgi:import inner membrane translocase subunit TIM22
MLHRRGAYPSKVPVLDSQLRLLQYRAKNDIGNSIAAGFISGGILARNSGPKAALGGGLAFAAFSAVIDLFLRRETPE